MSTLTVDDVQNMAKNIMDSHGNGYKLTSDEITENNYIAVMGHICSKIALDLTGNHTLAPYNAGVEVSGTRSNPIGIITPEKEPVFIDSTAFVPKESELYKPAKPIKPQKPKKPNWFKRLFSGIYSPYAAEIEKYNDDMQTYEQEQRSYPKKLEKYDADMEAYKESKEQLYARIDKIKQRETSGKAVSNRLGEMAKQQELEDAMAMSFDDLLKEEMGANKNPRTTGKAAPHISKDKNFTM